MIEVLSKKSICRLNLENDILRKLKTKIKYFITLSLKEAYQPRKEIELALRGNNCFL